MERSVAAGMPTSRSRPRTRRRPSSAATVETPSETAEMPAAMRMPM